MLSVTREMLIPHSEYYRKRSRGTQIPQTHFIFKSAESSYRFPVMYCRSSHRSTGILFRYYLSLVGATRLKEMNLASHVKLLVSEFPRTEDVFSFRDVLHGVTWKSPTLPSISEQDFSIARLKVEKYSQQFTSILHILSPWLDTWRIYKYPTDLFTPWWCQACGSEKRQPPSQENQTNYWQSRSIKRARGCLRRRKCPVLQMCPS